jgi:hypothetical protein
MPRLNRPGDLWCAGIAGVGLFVGDFDAADRPRLLGELHPAGMRAWLNDVEAVTQYGDSEIRSLNARTGEVRTLARHGAGEVFAGGGAWASFYWRHGDPRTDGVRTSTGLILPDAYVGAGTGPLRNDCVGPDGSIAIRERYHSTGPWYVYPLRGVRWLLTMHDAANIQLLGGARVIFRVGWTWVAIGSGVPAPQPLAVPAWHLKLLDVNGVWWLVYQDEIDGGRVVAHPNGDPRGYILGRARDAFGLDAVQLPDGRVRAIWATSEGELPGSLVTATFRTTDTRVNLTAPTPRPQPAPVPEPAPEPKPEDPVFDDATQIAIIARIAREVDQQHPRLRNTDLERYQAIVAWRCFQADRRIGRKSNHGTTIAVSRAALGIRYSLESDTSQRVLMTAVDYVRDETGVPDQELMIPGDRNGIRPHPEIHRDTRQYWIAPAPVPSGDEDDPGDSDQKPGPGPVADPALLPIVQELAAAALQFDIAAVRLDESIAALRAVKPAPTPAPHECPTPRWPDDHECPVVDLAFPMSEPDVQALVKVWTREFGRSMSPDLLTFLLYRLIAEGAAHDELLAEVHRRK